MKKGNYARVLVLGLITLSVGTAIIPSEITTGTIIAIQTAPIELIINNDGSGEPTDHVVDVPAYIPDSGVTPTIRINFTIKGVNSSETTAFYGDDPWEDRRNITISGDILYPVDDTTLYHVGTKGDWNCVVTPTKPGGTINLSLNWPGNGTATETLQIINGTFITPEVDSFPWGVDFKLIVTVVDMDGAPVKDAHVYLLWEETDNEFNSTVGTNQLGNGQNGEYWFWVLQEEQGGPTPKNITVAAQWYGAFWGYTKITMTAPPSPPNLEIGAITGGLGMRVQIKNNGTTDATTVSVTINFTGAWMIVPRLEQYHTSFNLSAGESKNVPVLIFGLGKTTIHVEVSCAEGSSATKTATGTVFLFFMFGVH